MIESTYFAKRKEPFIYEYQHSCKTLVEKVRCTR